MMIEYQHNHSCLSLYQDEFETFDGVE